MWEGRHLTLKEPGSARAQGPDVPYIYESALTDGSKKRAINHKHGDYGSIRVTERATAVQYPKEEGTQAAPTSAFT